MAGRQLSRRSRGSDREKWFYGHNSPADLGAACSDTVRSEDGFDPPQTGSTSEPQHARQVV